MKDRNGCEIQLNDYILYLNSYLEKVVEINNLDDRIYVCFDNNIYRSVLQQFHMWGVIKLSEEDAIMWKLER